MTEVPWKRDWLEVCVLGAVSSTSATLVVALPCPPPLNSYFNLGKKGKRQV